jgi:hypothetical protein
VTEKTRKTTAPGRRGWRIAGGIALVLLMFVILDSGLIPWGYVRSAEVSGRIIDKETGQPIPHAVISIWWPQMIGTLGGTIHVGGGTIKRIEVVSDEHGRYRVPGWKRSKWEIGKGGFTKDRVEMDVYAAGYWPRTLRNRGEGGLGWGEAWKAEWDGEDIELEPMHWQEWSRKEWEKNRSRRIGGPGFQDCQWLEHPDMLIENIRMANRENEVFGRKEYRMPGMVKFYRRLSEECDVSPFEILHKHGLSREEWKACCEHHKTLQPVIEKILPVPRESVKPLGKEKKGK